uniref:Uncharacterized protein n=1 Tax=Catharus ustulatus TaxID=91951 RepID=A0A8C3UBT4_CATUS
DRGAAGPGPAEQERQAEAEALQRELLEDYRFGRQQLIEIWGHASAVAVTKVGLGTLRRGWGRAQSPEPPSLCPSLSREWGRCGHGLGPPGTFP